MPSRINHVKLVSPRPEVVHAFLTQVCDLPEGWPLGDTPALPADAPLGPGGRLTQEDWMERRGSTGGGFIAGDPNSRQVQALRGGTSSIWAMCISTRDLEAVYERALARGVPCTPVTVADWNERDDIRNFFCLVDDLLFEVIRVEPKVR